MGFETVGVRLQRIGPYHMYLRSCSGNRLNSKNAIKDFLDYIPVALIGYVDGISTELYEN